MHHVRISKGFWLGKCTVTNAQYQQYCKTVRAAVPLAVPRPSYSAHGDHPVVGGKWEEVQRYCSHYGLRLPTEAEWEYAARGPEGRKYPWGNEWDPKKCCDGDNQGPGGRTFPVGSFPKGRRGAGRWTWRGTCGSGARTGMTRSTTPPRRMPIRQVPSRARICAARQVMTLAQVACCGAGRGIALVTAIALTAAPAVRRTATSASVFARPGLLRLCTLTLLPSSSPAGLRPWRRRGSCRAPGRC